MTEPEKQPEEIDLLELAKTVWSKRRFIAKLCIIAAIAGIVIAFSIPNEYSTTLKMAPEGMKTTQSGGGMADLAAMAGINIGGNSTFGINMSLYPDIVASTPFIIEMSQITVQGKKMAHPVTLYDYVESGLSAPWWSYLIKAPMSAIGWVFSLGREKEKETPALDPHALTLKQRGVLDNLRARMVVVVDKKSNTLTASAKMQDPNISAIVADSLVKKLQEYMSAYFTEKAKRDLAFTANLLSEAKQHYHEAQSRYAVLMDATQNAVRQSAKVEQERLRNEQQLAYNVYNQMTQQHEMAKIKVQEQTPVVTIIEPASVPTKKSNTSKLVILIAFTFIGAIIGIGIVTGKALLSPKTESE